MVSSLDPKAGVCLDNSPTIVNVGPSCYGEEFFTKESATVDRDEARNVCVEWSPTHEEVLPEDDSAESVKEEISTEAGVIVNEAQDRSVLDVHDFDRDLLVEA